MKAWTLLLSAIALAGALSVPASAQSDVSPAVVTNLSGTMTIVKGTLKTAVLPSNTAQTVTVMVGTTATAVTNVLVAGMPTGGSGYNVGDPFIIIKAGSAPFASNFTTLSVIADAGNSFMPALSRRTVPMTNTGVLSKGIGFPAGTYGSAVQLLYPPCTVSGLSFNNGVVVNLSAFPASYAIALPTTATIPTSTVLFRPDEVPPYSFAFLARSAKATLQVGGSGNVRNLNIAAGLDVAASVFQTATLTISQNNYIF